MKFTLLGVGLFLLRASVGGADKAEERHESVWEIRENSPAGFNTPVVYYGEWVPLPNAKNTIKAVAESIISGQHVPFGIPAAVEHQPAEVQPIDRLDIQAPKAPRFNRHRKRQRQQQQQQHHLRRQDRLRPVNTRRQRKLGQKKEKSFVERITSFFTGGNADLEPSPSIAQPVIGPSLPPPKSAVLPATAETSFNFGHFLPNILRQKPPRKQHPIRHHHIPNGDVPKPVIKLVPAPDLTQVIKAKH